MDPLHRGAPGGRTDGLDSSHDEGIVGVMEQQNEVGASPGGTRPVPDIEAVTDSDPGDLRTVRTQARKTTRSGQYEQLRGSMLSSMRREGLSTIDSGRRLVASGNVAETQGAATAVDPVTKSSSSRVGFTVDDLSSSRFSLVPNFKKSGRSSMLGTKFKGAGLRKGRLSSQVLSIARADAYSPDEFHEPIKSAIIRRYNPGESVLINNQSLGWVKLVNRHGYPSGYGDSAEERRGPYRFVIATVKAVHFEEVQAYYTVTLMYSGTDQRADAEYMHPILTTAGKEAAIKAATSSVEHPELNDDDGIPGHVHQDEQLSYCGYAFLCCLSILYPLFWLYEMIEFVGTIYIMPCTKSTLAFLRFQGELILNGKGPYECPVRFTAVNFVVICSAWYMFIDQVRLSFLPPSSDTVVAKMNLFVWVILVLELLFQVFIRPDGFSHLVATEKAYSPTTIRYINWLHLYVEIISLLCFIPEFLCVCTSKYDCDDAIGFSFHNAVLFTVIGPTRLQAFYGHAYFALVRLRVFGVVRHWRNMWVTNTFIKMRWTGKHTQGIGALVPLKSSKRAKDKRALLATENESLSQIEQKKRNAALTNASTIGTALMAANSYRAFGLFWFIIGIFPLISCVSSLYENPIGSKMTMLLEQTNFVANADDQASCNFLGDSVWAWITAIAPPVGFQSSSSTKQSDPYLMTLEISPQRCPFQSNNGTLNHFCQMLKNEDSQTFSESQGATLDTEWSRERTESFQDLCQTWQLTSSANDDKKEIASSTGTRQGSILLYTDPKSSLLTRFAPDGTAVTQNETFMVISTFDATRSVELAASSCLLLQLCLLFGILGGLSLMRRDAEVLVLNPLRRMLKKVAQYAMNPLIQSRTRVGRTSHRYSKSRSRSIGRSNDDFSGSASDSSSDDELELGSYETEQLISAVNKITDLLRKCWGVAGAGIISENLARTEAGATVVFNPTVPGKSVYALFGFAYINDFDHILMSLQDDVMILINDVAAVLHDEVFRWGFGDSGQCNKNLGAAFLMVFRIGLVKEVMEKLEQATDVIFSTSKGNSMHGMSSSKPRRTTPLHRSPQGRSRTELNRVGDTSVHAGFPIGNPIARPSKRLKALQKKNEVNPQTLSLQSLPGISTFTDRAVIGMLKAFAGIHRDTKIRNWNNDFRLSAGVGAFEVSMIYGMDAGWAVEGAVGSEYKIDATYLSPHVNMASRMMMASKQYGVKIMLSQSVEELMSDTAKSKLRHLDTVTVKGSSVKQRIYTYDARAQGVDFFLFSRSEDQADYDAEKYTPRIWDTDQDLISMRQHVSDKFLSTYTKGHKAYIQGDWERALLLLEQANEIMIETALEEGYLEDQFEALHGDAKAEEELKRLSGDGPSLYLIAFMKSMGGKAPADWEGWHPLTRK